MSNEINKWRVVTKATDSQPKIRMSFEMKETLKERAFENGRTFNNEILVRLANTLYQDEKSLLINKEKINENI